RALRLLSRSSSFIRSTIDLRQSNFSFDFFASASRLAATSTTAPGFPAATGVPEGAAPEAATAPAVGAGAACASDPKIAALIVSKMPMVNSCHWIELRLDHTKSPAYPGKAA